MNDKVKKAKFEAYIGYYQSFMSYFGSYIRAVGVLINHVEEKESSVDTIAYPIMFLVRQCLELGLKANIRYFKKYSKVNNHVKANTHHLKPLQDAFKVHILKTIENLKNENGVIVDKGEIDEFNNYFAKLDQLTTIFDKLDKDSDAFRYPVDKKEEDSFEHSETVNILEVYELLKEVETLLAYTAAVFQKYTDYADTIEQYYREEMEKMYQP
ncbi:hypothetical protein SAMN05660909_05396 [Chitinophaga terrae (ex Kim and Jung 2007)]|uniref:HEPN AbiU2-like domain-containing protein n=1 Tax=Chitinophaga terrae (ex Kim and Jung 2007) TaxID=408074 RepID=A0A1H4GIN9_9BACT|nr:hypothetical protein [Chitinophaga terrae (ex Kim and Jung 2007)]GEP93497.1 hypothetical protein CTE07_51420 [Chitinophaga terrae (ex Kim and Jung 2007)]SEB09489.1 hypothetical protein SAMN05660909_05396 [Chitinophaga terrae (ex Kim and Jung 2007)]